MKRHWLAQNEESRTSTLVASLKECKKHCFPKLYVSLKIDWECERNFSAMRRLQHGFGHQCHHNNSPH